MDKKKALIGLGILGGATLAIAVASAKAKPTEHDKASVTGLKIEKG